MPRKKTLNLTERHSPPIPPSLKPTMSEREIAGLRTLQRVSQEITAHLDFRDVCQSIYRGTSELMACDAFYIALYDEKSETLDFPVRIEQGIILPSMQVKLDEGVASCVVRTRQGVNVRDAEIDSRFTFKHWGMGPPTRSLIAVPMSLHGKIIGVLSAQSYEPGSYDELDLRILTNFAAQAAIAIQNAQLFAESQRKMKQFQVLNDVGRLVSSTIEIGQLLDLIYDQVRRVLKADAYYVTLYDPEKRTQRFEILVDDGERFPPQEQPLGEGLTSFVIRRRAPLLIQSASVEAPRLGIQRKPIGSPRLCESWLGVPLLISGHLLGVLAVASYQPRAFDEGDQELLQSIGIQAAIAIQNARLFADTDRKVKQLAVLNEVGRIVSSTIEIDRLLELIYEQVSRIIPADTYFVTLADFEKQIRTIELLVDEGERFPRTQIPLGDGLAGVVINRRAPLLVRNLEQEAAQFGIPYVQVGKARLSQSWLGVPMITAEHLVGTLAVASYLPDKFNASDIEILQNVATQAAIAIDNARHHSVVEEQAQRDSLTLALNHGNFVQSLQAQIQRGLEKGESLALIMLDVDNFKDYNDRYGHLAGDAILRGTVQAIRQNVKQSDLIGRWGGEEFAMALLGTTVEGACAVAERIRTVLAEMTLRDDRGRPVPTPTVSQGIAVCPQDAQEAFLLVDVADRRLYAAKERGRDQVQSD